MSLSIKNRLMVAPKVGKWFVVGIVLMALIAGVWGLRLYNDIYKSNVVKDGLLFVPTGADFQQVVDSLDKGNFLKRKSSFQWVANQKNYPQRIRPGAYMIRKGWSNNKLVDLLRQGNQTPVKVTFNNIRFREELAARLAAYLEPDSAAFLSVMNNEKVASDMGFSHETLPVIFIPNTYEIYWNISPLKFVQRMKWEYDKFWNDSRKQQAAKLGLSPSQIVTVASIVQEETNKNEEKPRMAGVYINRLKRGWLLQADPTVRYALGNFGVKRILSADLSIDSPYNTYKYAGLPPGPINFPDIVSVEAVLNAEQHDYLYFSAKEDFSGYHYFAKSLAEHTRNAARYQQALNKSRIWR